jgi:hypothetical protein
MPDNVRSRLWVWGHEAGSHNDAWHLPGKSHMTPVESAYYLGVPNALMVVYNNKPEPPFDRLAVAFRPLQQVVWSILGDSSSGRNNWDYDSCQPMPIALMEHPCRLGLPWLHAGRIDGIIFLASCICDLELEAVEWTRRWIARVGEEPL